MTATSNYIVSGAGNVVTYDPSTGNFIANGVSVSGDGKTNLVIFGDSITAFSTIVDATKNQYTDRGPICWANALGGNRFSLVKNAGIGGDTSGGAGDDPYASGGLSRYATDVRPYVRGALVLILFGTNDLTIGTSADIIFRNLKLIYEAVRADGGIPIAVTVPPAETGFGFNQDAARRYQWALLNRTLRNYCAVTPNLPLADFAAVLSDVNSNTGNPMSIYSMVTGVHLKARAARACGETVANVLESYGAARRTAPNNAETWAVNNASSNIAPVARMTASGGAVSTGCTGVVSSGIVALRTNGSNATAVAATVPRRVQDTTAWASATAYTVGAVRRATVLDPSKTFAYVCTTAGTSGASEPTWPTVAGQTVTDNGTVWTCIRTSSTDKPGYWQALVVTGAGAGAETVSLNAYFGVGSGGTAGKLGWSVGQTLTAEAEVQMQGASGVQGCWLSISGFPSYAVGGLNLSETAASDYSQADFAGVIAIPPTVIPATVTPGTTQLAALINLRLDQTGKAILLADCLSIVVA